MKITLSFAAKKAITILEDNGFMAYAVGGCVRDCVMGKAAHDYDITTSALPQQMKECFSGFKTIETGLKHGTLTVLIEGEALEITTFRIDKDYKDHRHPDSVVFTDKLIYDLERRDFTVNAMAYSERAGLVDLFGGREDIKNGIIRCVGDSDTRFGEDALRIMRALRFAAVLDFDIAEETKISIHKNKQLLEFIAKERIQTELNKLICAKNPGKIILEFKDVFAFVLGDWVYDLKEERAELIGNLLPDCKIRLAMLMESLDADRAGDVLNKLKYDNATKKAVSVLLEHKDRTNSTDRIYIKKLLNKIGDANFVMLVSLMSADSKSRADEMIQVYSEIKAENMCYTIAGLKVSGSDVCNLGIKGSNIGDVLGAVLDAVICERLDNDRDKIIEFIKKYC